MRKYFFIGLFCLSVNSAIGLQLGLDTWINVTHEINELTFINSGMEQKLSNILIDSQKEFSEEFENYQYFQLYVKSNKNCQALEFRLSNYPYKSEDLIGFVPLGEHLIFVHNELPTFLKITDIKKSFSYTEWKIGNLTMREDDTPCWIIENCDCSFKILQDPTGKKGL